MLTFYKEPTSLVKAALSDVDKTLYSGPPGDAYMTAAAERELQEIAKILGQSVETVRAQLQETRERITEEQGQKASRSQAVMAMGVTFQQWNELRLKCYEPEKYLQSSLRLVRAVEALLAHIPLVLSSNSPTGVIERVIDVLGLGHLRHRFCLVGPDTAGHPKPNAAYFQYAFAQCPGIPVTSFAVIGDRPANDLETPVRMGVDAAIHVQNVDDTIAAFWSLARQIELGADQLLMSVPQIAAGAFRRGQTRTLAITGQAGSGKTTLARRIQSAAERAGIPVHLLSLDKYFKLSSAARKVWLAEAEGNPELLQQRRDQLTWWDFEKLLADLEKLSQGDGIYREGVYNRADAGELTGTLSIPACDGRGRLIVLEGVGLPHLNGGAPITQMIFTHADPHVRFARIRARDRQRRPEYSTTVDRFKLTQEFERPYFAEHWGKIDTHVNNAGVIPSLAVGLTTEEALHLNSSTLMCGIPEREA